MPTIVILKYDDGPNNYWGNEKRPDGIGLLTHPWVAIGVCDALRANPSLFVARKGYFGPLECERKIERVKGFYRFVLTGNIRRPASGIFPSARTVERVQQALNRAHAHGVVVTGNEVSAFHLGHGDPPAPKLPSGFMLAEETP